jgi:hypothetical protein
MVNVFVDVAVGRRICQRICSQEPCAQDQQVAVCVCGREGRVGWEGERGWGRERVCACGLQVVSASNNAIHLYAWLLAYPLILCS